jgi:putative transcriptional regulator
MWATKHRRAMRSRNESYMRTKDPEALRRWRNRRGLSQRDLAYLCRCSQATISLIERGEMRNLSEDLAMALAKRLDVPWEDLFEARSDARLARVVHGARTTARKGAA